jgi:predicted cupin superfamily sugar epimerase
VGARDDAQAGATLTVGSAAQLVQALGLAAHPEGGWFREIHRSVENVSTARGPRAALTCIDYLLEAGQMSRWHVVASDEIWHFHGGALLELLVFRPADGSLSRRILGPPAPGQHPAGVVRAGEWQAARSLGDWSLVGCDVGPGFDFADFALVSTLPGHERHFRGALAPYSDLL